MRRSSSSATPPSFNPRRRPRLSSSTSTWRRPRRGDFELDWDPATRRGSTRHSANPYSIDSALRVLHTFLLAQGPQTRLEPVTPAQAARALLRNILFFAADAELVRLVFQSACEFLRQVPVFQLEFAPTPAVWEVIR